MKCDFEFLCLQFKGHWCPSGYTMRIVGKGILPWSVYYCCLDFTYLIEYWTSSRCWEVAVIWSCNCLSRRSAGMGNTWRGSSMPLHLRMFLVWMIDYLLFYVPLKNFSLIRRRHHCRWRAAKFRPMLGAQGLSSSCHTCCDMGPRFFRSSYDTRGDMDDLF
jgi:hypothetical protein